MVSPIYTPLPKPANNPYGPFRRTTLTYIHSQPHTWDNSIDMDADAPDVTSAAEYAKAYCIERDRREGELIKALGKVGISYRYDSKLCGRYIIGTLENTWTLDKIVQRMCEVKLLYEYTPMYTFYSMHKHDMTLEEAERLCMLHTFGVEKYPPGLWPWLRV